MSVREMVGKGIQLAKLIEENKEVFETFIDKGLIDPRWIRDRDIWKAYQQLPDTMHVMQRYYFISIREGVSEKTVRRAVNFFEKN